MTDDDRWQRDMATRVGRAVRDLRGDRSVQWVSDATHELGCRVTRTVLTDMEIGRRKMVAAHELVMLSAVLGVTPATLLTWGDVPDGQVEVLPGRTLDAMTAAAFWGGEPLPRLVPSVSDLPRPHDASTELIALSRDRDQLRRSLLSAATGGHTYGPDPALVPALKERLKGVLQRIRDLGGVLSGGGDDG